MSVVCWEQVPSLQLPKSSWALMNTLGKFSALLSVLMGAEIPIFKINISLFSCILYSKHRHVWGGVSFTRSCGFLTKYPWSKSPIPHSQASHFPSQHTDRKISFSDLRLEEVPSTFSPSAHPHHSIPCQMQVPSAFHHVVSLSHGYTESGIL